MLEYRVPFFIWTNYKSKTEYVDCIGINYLSNLLYERANIAMPPYNQYLETLRRTIPYCNSFGYYSISRKEFIPLNEAQDEERKALLEYNYLEWNSIFDDENKNKNMFPVE